MIMVFIINIIHKTGDVKYFFLKNVKFLIFFSLSFPPIHPYGLCHPSIFPITKKPLPISFLLEIKRKLAYYNTYYLFMKYHYLRFHHPELVSGYFPIPHE